ncbi:hypothetical protein FRX31_019178 [Thalictrum thalictroides]|uniref:Uncharacterized protein n=1 Tax=Thalictrum thalictroides TaxID=46969 RepID=A0A7J6W222_THATH|nr:hypothetical protein FRX31_019178 [Thalictrum thalictroides]
MLDNFPSRLDSMSNCLLSMCVDINMNWNPQPTESLGEGQTMLNVEVITLPLKLGLVVPSAEGQRQCPLSPVIVSGYKRSPSRQEQ